MNTEQVRIKSLAIHYVGNKKLNDGYRHSEANTTVSPNLENHLKTWFLSHFHGGGFFHFKALDSAGTNEVMDCVEGILTQPESFHNQSKRLALRLYEHSAHPKIKGGELYVVHFGDCELEGENFDAIGIFKAETRETFLKVKTSENTFHIDIDEGNSINKLDKGCLVFDTERDKGFRVSVVDNLSRGSEARFWMEDFLSLRPRNDSFFQTRNAIDLCKQFVAEHLPEKFEISRADQSALLNRSSNFFKDNEKFGLQEFASDVIKAPEVVEAFRSFTQDFQNEKDIQFEEQFEISDQALKKASRVFKSIIKLDKNFHIYVHGDHHKIVKGYDDSSGLHYYQLFFKEEN